MADLLNIELARPGTWNLASGKTEFTLGHLRDAADFFTATGGQKIPLALGHNDPRFSGDPSFGNVANVRYEEDDRGPVLKGDLVDMPEWLHAAAPKRWPNRSVEGYQNVEFGGRTYKLALTALALLGVTPPGVRNIQSLKELQLALAASAAQRIVAMAPDEPPPEEPEMDSAAAPPPVPPPSLEPQAPAEPGASPSPAPVTAAEAARQIHAAATRPTKKEGAGLMDPAKIREALGLAPDVSDDEVKAALVTAGLAAPPTPSEGEPAPAKETVHAAAPPGTIVLASSVWEQTQDTIKDLTSFVERTKRDERDQVIAKAVEEGKFTPAQRSHFAKLWDADPDGTRNLIGSLHKNSALAVAAMGYSGDRDDLDAELAQFDDLYPPHMRLGKKGA